MGVSSSFFFKLINLFILSSSFLKRYYLFIWERESGERISRQEREKQAPRGQGAQSGIRSQDLEDHDLTQRQTLNQLSHPGVPTTLTFAFHLSHLCSAFRFLSLPFYFFFLRFYLFMRDRERERHRYRLKEEQASCREPGVGLDPGSPGSHPGPKAALNRWATLAAHILAFLKVDCFLFHFFCLLV